MRQTAWSRGRPATSAGAPDHRVVDGATLARAAEAVRQVVEEPDVMIMQLR